MSDKETCNGNHWQVIENRLYLTTENEERKELLKDMIKVLEKEIRTKVYDDIIAWKPLDNRRQIMKISGSIDNALLGVQAICADIALGNTNERTV